MRPTASFALVEVPCPTSVYVRLTVPSLLYVVQTQNVAKATGVAIKDWGPNETFAYFVEVRGCNCVPVPVAVSCVALPMGG